MPKKLYNWAVIQRFHEDGHGFVECQKRFGFSHTAWVKAIKRGELRSSEPVIEGDRRRKYDWAEVQRFYDQGNSYRVCLLHFGFCAAAWEKARKRGEIKTRKSSPIPLEELLSRNGSRHYVKQRLLSAGILSNMCQICGISDWLGRPLNVHIDHVNGVRDDHRLENLRMLCPNCHSQTDTYGAKNRLRKRLQEDQGTM